MHSLLIVKTGGIDGVRDKNLLASALETPFQTFGGAELYKTILDKASQFCYSLIENHPFLDGNKSRLLMLNTLTTRTTESNFQMMSATDN
ncbi:MAG: Fic family protein [Treponema sp.]|nr:Fic family protein [Treponema sp.]